jgi:hypothetical protein
VVTLDNLSPGEWGGPCTRWDPNPVVHGLSQQYSDTWGTDTYTAELTDAPTGRRYEGCTPFVVQRTKTFTTGETEEQSFLVMVGQDGHLAEIAESCRGESFGIFLARIRHCAKKAARPPLRLV